jgi:hypothetical protein
MARPGDQGPYAVGNVKIITMQQNSAETDPAKISKAGRANWASPDYRAKLAKSLKAVRASPTYRAKQVQAQKVIRAKHSERSKALWADPTYRNNHAKAMTAWHAARKAARLDK